MERKSIKEIKGDLIALAKRNHFNVIIHGCNCQGVMGKGIAFQIKQNFPKVSKIDSKGELPGTICAVTFSSGLTVVNAYTQIYWGKANDKHKSYSPVNNHEEELYDTQKNRYEFIRSCLRSVNKIFTGKKIGLPLIGCGLAGGSWDIVKSIIIEEMNDCDVTIVHFNSEA